MWKGWEVVGGKAREPVRKGEQGAFQEDKAGSVKYEGPEEVCVNLVCSRTLSYSTK